MGKVKVGYRQLCLARGCSTVDDQEISHTLKVAGFDVKLYLGRKPDLVIATQTKKVIPLDPTRPGPVPMGIINIQPVEKSDFAGGFFTDIFCSKEIEVDDALIGLLYNPATAANGKIKILDFVKKTHGAEFEAVSNFIAGTLGLRIHFQFLYEVVNEIYWLFSEKDNNWSIDSVSSDVLHILDSTALNRDGINYIKSLQFRDDASIKEMRAEAIALHLLKRAWQEHQGVPKFINLFTALEVAIKSHISGTRSDVQQINKRLEKFFEENAADKNEKSELLKSLKSITSIYKPLTTMFEELANEANYQTKDDDIEAFKKFNKVRNELLHGGRVGNIGTSVLENANKVIFLDLVERYINWICFRDNQYYVKRGRDRVSFN